MADLHAIKNEKADRVFFHKDTVSVHTASEACECKPEQVLLSGIQELSHRDQIDEAVSSAIYLADNPKRFSMLLSQTPERLLVETRALYKRGLESGAPETAEMAECFRRSIAHLEKYRDVNGAMREFLPFVRALAKCLPIYEGLKLLFIYRLTMLDASLDRSLGIGN